MRKFLFLALAVTLSACSTHFDMSKQEGIDGYLIYRLSQEQAFAIAYNAIVTVLPGRKISEIGGPVKGYSTWSRFLLDTYTQQVVVIPAKGTTKDGETVEGFYFEVSGSGSSGSGRTKNVSLYRTVQENLDQLNIATVVPRIEKGSYKEPVFATKAKTSRPPPPRGTTVEERLKELKSLLDQGLLSKKEYTDKRAKIIQSL